MPDTWLFLRNGKLLPDSVFDWKTLGECDDMWTQLFAAMCKAASVQGVVQWRGKSKKKWSLGNGIWQESVDSDKNFGHLGASVIFTRGRYSYRKSHRLSPDAYRIYYGAGRNYLHSPDNHHMILVDAEDQIAGAQSRFTEATVLSLVKPASDNIFKPVKAELKYDIVFICHTLKEFKGYQWLVERLPAGTKVLRIGPKDPWFGRASKLQTTWTGKIRRSKIPKWACQAVCGVVCDDGLYDSGPRVLPELLAMGIPVIVRQRVVAPLDDYIRKDTGVIVGDGKDEVAKAIARFKKKRPDPSKYYRKKLSLQVVAERLVSRVLTEMDEAPYCGFCNTKVYGRLRCHMCPMYVCSKHKTTFFDLEQERTRRVCPACYTDLGGAKRFEGSLPEHWGSLVK